MPRQAALPKLACPLPLSPDGDAASAADALLTTGGNVVLGRSDIAPHPMRFDHPTAAINTKAAARDQGSRTLADRPVRSSARPSLARSFGPQSAGAPGGWPVPVVGTGHCPGCLAFADTADDSAERTLLDWLRFFLAYFFAACRCAGVALCGSPCEHQVAARHDGRERDVRRCRQGHAQRSW